MKGLIVHDNPKSPISEAFRTLRTNIQFTSIDKRIHTLSITSTGASEGKSTTSGNLALTMAKGGKKVLVIDADLRRSRVHEIFQIPNFKGLTNLLVGDMKPKEVIHKIKEHDNLYVMTGGAKPPNPAELLGSEKMKELLENLKKDFDMIIVDTPPVGMVTDGALIASIVDGTIFVCSSGNTEIKSAVYTKELLKNVNANILGVVLNRVPIHQGGYYKYHYSTYYSTYEEDKPKNSRFSFFKRKK